MGEVSSFEAILGSGAGGPLTAPTPWLSFPGYIAYLAGGVVLGTPSGGNKGPGTLNAQSYYLNGNIVDPTKYLPLVGGVLTGILTLSANPVGTYDAATKGYVDTAITTVNGTLGGYLLKTGGTLTGPLILAADPTAALGAATKQYVDNGLANDTTAPSWVVGSPTGGNKGAGSTNTQTLYINGVLVNTALYLPFTGGVMTGILTLSANPVNPLDASTKGYVDTQITATNGALVNYLPKTGGTLTGPLVLAADPTIALGAATKQYVDNSISGSISVNSLVLGSPTGGNKGAGSLNAQTIYINGTLVNLGLYLPFTGGVMTGTLSLSADPVNPLNASTKQYVDNQIITVNGNFANYLPKTGGTLTGPLILAANPTTGFQAATKQYVDAISTGFTFPDAPSDGTVYGRQNASWVNTQIIDVGTF